MLTRAMMRFTTLFLIVLVCVDGSPVLSKPKAQCSAATKIGANCFGDDLPNGKLDGLISVEDCCTECKKLSGCRAFAVDMQSGPGPAGICYLKSGCSILAPSPHSPHTVAGVLNASDFPSSYPPSWWTSTLPRLSSIDTIMTNGHSSGGDMAIQMHVAFSSVIKGTCGFDAQPYHCAATRFPNDALVPQSAESSVGRYLQVTSPLELSNSPLSYVGPFLYGMPSR